jgi:hypothetical protein
MAIYTSRDISLTLGGDIEIGANGDIKLATSHESIKNQVTWFLKTDKGQYQPDEKLGCNVGSFIGDSMSNDLLISIEDTVRAALFKYVVVPQDINVDALPLSYDHIGVFVTLVGQYLDDDGNLLDVNPEVISYDFPFLEGSPSAI